MDRTKVLSVCGVVLVAAVFLAAQYPPSSPAPALRNLRLLRHRRFPRFLRFLPRLQGE